jgi:hypothetical protein
MQPPTAALGGAQGLGLQQPGVKVEVAFDVSSCLFKVAAGKGLLGAMNAFAEVDDVVHALQCGLKASLPKPAMGRSWPRGGKKECCLGPHPNLVQLPHFAGDVLCQCTGGPHALAEALRALTEVFQRGSNRGTHT